MADALLLKDACTTDQTLAAAVAAGDIWQLPDGRAGVFPTTLASGALGAAQTEGHYTVTKTASVVITKGQPVYWDHSANSATYAPASDRDFFLGTAVDDAASADTTMVVNLNVWPSYKIEMGRGRIGDEFLTVIVKTVVGSTTVEVPKLEYWPGAARMTLGATAEAQKVDLLSQQSFAVASNWIVEFGFNIIDDGDAAAIDFNIGVANGTHATDFNSITERCAFHTDANVLDILAWSTDGTTTVALTDTTTNYALATPIHGVIDGRNPADIQMYLNGVLQLTAEAFKLDAATGPLKLIAHLEKTSDDETGDYRINYLRVRTMEQD